MKHINYSAISYYETLEEKQKDLKLQKAAPELLDALQNIISCNGVGYSSSEQYIKDLQQFIIEGQKAIKKATQ